MRRLLLPLSLMLLLVAPVMAQSTRPADTRPDDMSPQQRMREYVRLNGELRGLLEKKDYAAGADICRRMAELAPKVGEPRYNLACCLARLGRTEQALDELEGAVGLGFNDVSHIRDDEDLASLRELPRFKKILGDMAADQKQHDDKLYEKGKPVPGVKTVEGSPEGGLRWRLHMSPNASPDRPDRLIVWLHPSGGSMNAIVEPLAASLVKQRFALLVLTAKQWSGWRSDEAEKLTKRTLPDVAKVKGLDADRPILFGYSAGGQLALMLWYQTPEKFGGLVLDAAYPVVPNRATGRVTLMSPPKKEAITDCPFFVLVGEQDNGANAWRMAEEPFKQAGVPVTIHYIPKKGHTWLFDSAQQQKLYQWLKDVAAGKKPGEPAAESMSPTTRPAGPLAPIKLQDVY